MTQILYEPLPLGFSDSVFSQSVFLAYIHLRLSFQSVLILHKQRHNTTPHSEHFLLFLGGELIDVVADRLSKCAHVK